MLASENGPSADLNRVKVFKKIFDRAILEAPFTELFYSVAHLNFRAFEFAAAAPIRARLTFPFPKLGSWHALLLQELEDSL